MSPPRIGAESDEGEGKRGLDVIGVSVSVVAPVLDTLTITSGSVVFVVIWEVVIVA